MNFFEITWETFPGLHSDNRTLTVPFNGESIRDLYYSYTDLFNNKLLPIDIGESFQPIVYYVVNFPETLSKEPLTLMNTLNECE